MYSKLGIISNCLLLKGQNAAVTEDDGSDTWNVCSAAYDQGAKHLIQEHDWKFGTAIAALSRTGDSDDPAFEDKYERPNGCLHLIKVWLDDNEYGENYRLVGNAILLTDGSAEAVYAKFVLEPDPSEWPPMFVTALQEWVFWGIESGLKKDQAAADRHMLKADAALQRARTRVDQQEPKRALVKTRWRTSRQYRRG